ncbi:MAG: ABC transporter ATP-binding protein [Desulfitobacteriaceae bacterium]
MNILQAYELYRFYHTRESEVLALRGVNMHVAAGEIVAVMGPSGSGKSTLMNCLVGLDEPDGGYVQFLDQRLTRRPEAERAALRSSQIGILLQAGNLLSHLTVEDAIRLQMRLTGRSDEQKVSLLLDRVGLSARRHAYPAQLSGGEAARAGLAVALSTNPKLLVADEPTGEVDADTEQQIFRILAERRTAGDATLLVTHSPELAKRADRVIYLQDGRVLDDGENIG